MDPSNIYFIQFFLVDAKSRKDTLYKNLTIQLNIMSNTIEVDITAKIEEYLNSENGRNSIKSIVNPPVVSSPTSKIFAE